MGKPPIEGGLFTSLRHSQLVGLGINQYRSERFDREGQALALRER